MTCSQPCATHDGLDVRRFVLTVPTRRVVDLCRGCSSTLVELGAPLIEDPRLAERIEATDAAIRAQRVRSSGLLRRVAA